MAVDLRSQLERVPWASIAQPEWNAADDVPKAITAVAAATTRDEASRSYDQFLFAVGNNHAGTYFPVVLDAIPFLELILEKGTPVQRGTVLMIVMDLANSFAPDPNHRHVVLGGHRVDLEDELRRKTRELLPLIRSLTEQPTALPEDIELSKDELRSLLAELESGRGAPPLDSSVGRT